jgi:hypothetical protein
MPTVQARPAVTSRQHLELEAAGWQRRFEVDAMRAKELTDLYSELCYEVTTCSIEPEEIGAACAGCAVVACQRYVAVYTRRSQEVRDDQ